MSAPLERVLTALEARGHGKPQKKTGGDYAVRCPAHEDTSPSLSVTVGSDGRVLLHCHAGCDLAAILTAIGLRPADLFEAKPAAGGKKQIVATYDYRDESGAPLFEVVRFEPKDFRQRHRGPTGEWVWKMEGVRRVLYRLPELLKGLATVAAVWVVEGEKDVETLRSLGLTATCNPGGAGKWLPDYSASLKGASAVYVVPDNDKPGRDHAEAVAKVLREVVPVVRVVKLPGPGKDVSEWIAAGGTRARLEALAQAPGAPQSSDWPNDAAASWPTPVPIGARDVPPFPLDALPEWLGNFAAKLAVATQTPCDLPGLLTLAVLSAAAAKRARVELRDGWIEPLNLFVAVVLPPASRKSAVFAVATKPLREYERAEAARVRPERNAALSRLEVSERRLKRAQDAAANADAADLATANAEVARLTEEHAALTVPAEPRFIADDCTPERLVGLLVEQGGRIAVLSPEGGVFEQMAGRYSEKGANLDVYLKGHAGDDLRIDRVSRPTEYVPAPALTLGLAIQPDVLRSLRDQPGFRGRGLIGRFLFSLPRNTVGSRDVDAPSMPHEAATLYDRRMMELVAMAPAEDAEGCSTEHVLRLAEEARVSLRDFSRKLEPQLGPGGALEHIGDWAGKLAGAVGRIAGLLHLAGDGDPLRDPIGADTMSRAITLGSYLLEHARAAFDELGGTPALRAARAIYELLARSPEPQGGWTSRDVHQQLRGRSEFAQADALGPGFTVLEDQGWIRRQERRTGGRPTVGLKLHPLLRHSKHSKAHGESPSECFERLSRPVGPTGEGDQTPCAAVPDPEPTAPIPGALP